MPSVSHLRLASWAVTVAQPESSPAHVAASSLLLGLLQSPFRAESSAVVVALRFALASRQEVRIWSDCLGVVSKIRRLVVGARVGPCSRNADLWKEASDALSALGPRFKGIFKVEAHVDINDCDDEVVRWAAYNNGLVDAAAGQANLLRPTGFYAVGGDAQTIGLQ